MKKPVFEGVATALVTPFKNGTIDLPTLQKLMDRQIGSGIDAIVICGTTGESATLTTQEQLSLISHAVDYAAGRCKVIAGTGSNDTAYALKLSQEAEAMGADALLLVSPYYNKTSQTGLIKHFNYVAERVSLPCILYNVPSRTGCNIKPETYHELSKTENIVAAKEANGDISSVAETLALCGDNLQVYSGNDDQVVPMMSLGAKGVISVVANIAPEIMVNMTHLCLDGRFEEASRIQLDYMEFIDALFIEVNPIPIKAALNLVGKEAGPLRLPLCDMTNGHLDVLKAAMAKVGLL